MNITTPIVQVVKPRFDSFCYRRLAVTATIVLLFALPLAAAPSSSELLRPWRGVQGAFPQTVAAGGHLLVWGIGLDDMQVVDERGKSVEWERIELEDRVSDGELRPLRSLRVPDRAGLYTLSVIDAQKSVEVLVVPRPVPGPEVVIPPGLHRWSGPKELKEGTSVIAYGAVIDGQGKPLFKLAPNCRIVGGLYQNFSEFASSGNGDGLQIIDAHIRGGTSGVNWSQERLVIRDCTLERWFLYIFNVKGALLQRNRFIGLRREGHALRCLSARNMVMIDNIFDGTERGIVIQPQWGAVEHNLFYRNTFQNIDYIHGGNEPFLVEMGPHPFSWNMSFHQRVVNCGNVAVLIYGAAASDNLWYDLKSVNAGGIVLTDVPSHPDGELHDQVRNLFMRSELHGGVVRFGAKARHNVIAETGMVSPVPGRGSGQRRFPEWYRAGVIFDAAVVGNRIIRCSVYDRNGFTVARNVELNDVTIEPNDPRRQ